jgi:hypothetical protein
MNPYEAPQTPLQPEPEVRPRVPVTYETYNAIEMLKILGVIFLVLVEVCLGVMLLNCLSYVTAFGFAEESSPMLQLLPHVALGLLGNTWILWKLKQASDRKHS